MTATRSEMCRTTDRSWAITTYVSPKHPRAPGHRRHRRIPHRAHPAGAGRRPGLDARHSEHGIKRAVQDLLELVGLNPEHYNRSALDVSIQAQHDQPPQHRRLPRPGIAGDQLADPDRRGSVPLADVPADTVPPLGAIDAAVHALILQLQLVGVLIQAGVGGRRLRGQVGHRRTHLLRRRALPSLGRGPLLHLVGVLGEMAGDPVARGQLDQWWLDGATDLLRLPAAGVKAAGMRRIEGTGHVALQPDPGSLRPAGRVRDGHS
jgi:hypothetical protein